MHHVVTVALFGHLIVVHLLHVLPVVHCSSTHRLWAVVTRMGQHFVVHLVATASHCWLWALMVPLNVTEIVSWLNNLFFRVRLIVPGRLSIHITVVAR